MTEVSPKPIAALDIDGTVLKSSLVEKFITHAISQGLLKADQFNELADARKVWQESNNEGVYQAYLSQLIGAFVLSLKGVSTEQFTDISKTMLQAEAMRRFTFAKGLINLVRDSHHLVAISGSPKLLVEMILRDSHFQEIYGSNFMVENGVFTGQATSLGDKSAVIQSLLAKGGVTLEGSVGVGDTAGDIPLLDSVARPIMFNPSRTLLAHGRERGWLLVRESKDAVQIFRYNSETRRYEEERRSLQRLVHFGAKDETKKSSLSKRIVS